MRTPRLLLVICSAIAVAVGAGPQPSASNASSYLTVSGDATLVQPGSHEIERNASNIVLWLVPNGGVQQVSARTGNRHYRLVQHNKHFEPDLLVVPVGSVVDFPNLDPWFHNVFSLYRGKRFDLGLYQAGSTKSVSFDRPGPSYLFCNIHPEMTGVVLALESDLFGVSDKGGHYSIAGVPPGKYVMHVWYENAAPEALDALERPVTVEGEDRVMASISVPVIKQIQAEHKNKYGKDYDPDTLKTDY